MADGGRDRPASKRPRRGPGQLEAEILGVLWTAEGPLGPAEVQAALGRDLAYNTVHTILTRLHDKGLLARVPHGGRSGYVPVKNAAQDAADRMRDVLESGRERTAVERSAILAHFVTTLSTADEQALRAALHSRPPA